MTVSSRTGLTFYRQGFLQGRDFFISYSRADATAYVLTLAERLTQAGLTCDIDQWGSVPGGEIPTSLLRRLLRSQVLLVVGSPQALTSEAVGQEVRAFLTTQRPIVPITFGSLPTALWGSQVRGLALAVETEAALTHAQPSAAVVNRAIGTLRYTRQNRRIQRSIWSVAGALALLLAVAGGATLQTRQARRELRATERETVVANQARTIALAEARQAATARDTAAARLQATSRRAQAAAASFQKIKHSLRAAVKVAVGAQRLSEKEQRASEEQRQLALTAQQQAQAAQWVAERQRAKLAESQQANP